MDIVGIDLGTTNDRLPLPTMTPRVILICKPELCCRPSWRFLKMAVVMVVKQRARNGPPPDCDPIGEAFHGKAWSMLNEGGSSSLPFAPPGRQGRTLSV
jgi:hypothetical protein